MIKLITSLSLIFILNISNGYSQCQFNVNNNGFEYDLTIDLEISDVIYSQEGSTCNVQIEVAYDIVLNVINQAGWWNESLYTLQGNLNCDGASGASFFNLPNAGGTGTVKSATFSFSNQDCPDTELNCPLTLQISGPGGFNYNGNCGTYSNSSLPVVLENFSLISQTSITSLEWSTASETNFSHFVLERSYDGNNWESMDKIYGTNSTSGADYTNSFPSSSIDSYLRLKMIDLDGTFYFSNTLSVTSHQDIRKSVYPNPAIDKLYLNGTNTNEVKVVNNMGVEVVLPVLSNNSFDVSSLHSGYYNIIISNARGKEALSFIKL